MFDQINFKFPPSCTAPVDVPSANKSKQMAQDQELARAAATTSEADMMSPPCLYSSPGAKLSFNLPYLLHASLSQSIHNLGLTSLNLDSMQTSNNSFIEESQALQANHQQADVHTIIQYIFNEASLFLYSQFTYKNSQAHVIAADLAPKDQHIYSKLAQYIINNGLLEDISSFDPFQDRADSLQGIEFHDGAKLTVIGDNSQKVMKIYPEKGVYYAERNAYDEIQAANIEDLFVRQVEWDAELYIAYAEKLATCEPQGYKFAQDGSALSSQDIDANIEIKQIAANNLQRQLMSKGYFIEDLNKGDNGGDNIGTVIRSGERHNVIFDTKSLKKLKDVAKMDTQRFLIAK